ncbi:MAG: hypothetical protein EOO52_13550 [Gammaproteobacteria bacterium]|nr:MAG: hypothetical protein EOO52_13550 [Gammaproteobacteria bacterium]
MSGANKSFKIKLLAILAIFLTWNYTYALDGAVHVVSDPRLSHLGRIINEQLLEGPSISGLVVTVGPESLRQQLNANSGDSILALYTSSSEFRHIMATSVITNVTSARVSAIFNDVDPRYLVSLANALSPVGKKLIAVSPDTDLIINKSFEKFASEKGARISYLGSGDTKGMLNQMDSADVLIAYKDDALFSDTTIKPIISSLYRRKKVLIGNSRRLTTSGALASVHMNMDSYLTKAIVSINQSLKTGVPIGLRYSESIDVSVNKTLAKALGFYATDMDENSLQAAIIRAVESGRVEL